VSIVTSSKDEITKLLLSINDISDDNGEWENPNEAIGWRMKTFSSNFPPINVKFTSVKSVSTLVSKLAFSGLCCLHTKKVSSYPDDNIVAQNAPKDAIFVNDNTLLGTLRVRRGYQRYGAAAYFDKDCNLVGIYTCYDGKYLDRPEDLAIPLSDDNKDADMEDDKYAGWRHAMWAWRVSALALVTIADHLVNIHMVQANTLVSASTLHLPISHPLRCFLKIFTYRSIAINLKAYRTLMMRKGVVNRNWAIEDDDLQTILAKTQCDFKTKFPDQIPESMRDVDPKIYPINEDLPKYWEIVRELVHDFLCAIYDCPVKDQTEAEKQRLERNLAYDADLQNFLKELATGLELLQGRDLSDFDGVV